MKRRNDAPSPERIRDDLRELKRTLPSVLADYRWAYNFAFSVARRGGFGEGGRAGHSDPTGNVGVGKCQECDRSDADVETCAHDYRDPKESMRRVAREVAADVEEALHRIRAARARMKRHMGAKGRDFLGLPDPGQVVPKDEITAAREAQQRRVGRGEGWGDG